MALFSHIKTKTELVSFLKKEKNPYSTFILEKINRDRSNLGSQNVVEIHHILPKHAGGAEQPFNEILLTYEEHTEAHRLLYEAYQLGYDKAVFKMREGRTSEARAIISAENVEKMRQNKTGRFDSELQSKLGSLPKKPRKPSTRTNSSKIAFERGMIWVHEDGLRLVISPGAYVSPFELAEALVAYPYWGSYQDIKTKYLKPASKTSTTLYAGIIKLINGWRDQKTGKGIYRVGPWRLEGILLDELKK
jgi:hypothetical protein